MPKPAKSQWNFGELFSSEELRRVFSVSEITSTIRRLLEGQVGRVWVTGEITNLRLQTSGHAYFALKDAGAQLSCVLFRDEARAVLRETLRDGQQVVLQGEMTVYETRGQYQLRVTKVELQGVGALQVAFERLKQKLNAEGLFAAARKRPLPRYPQRIGVVTSPTGAAFRDVLHVIARRHPGLEIVLAPCLVQGQNAAAEIAGAIRLLNEFHFALRTPHSALDLILVTRGGGSLEDLWAFNEEAVARAIHESKLPVVSAVGHEIDFTISDFVADLRAATPSAAAEIITEGAFACREFVAQAGPRLRHLAWRHIAGLQEALARAIQRATRVNPRRRLQTLGQRLDDAETSLLKTTRLGLRRQQTHLGQMIERFVRTKPSLTLPSRRDKLERLRQEQTERVQRHLERLRHTCQHATERLRLLSPASVLERGYSITTDAATDRVIRDAATVQSGQRLRTKLRDGALESTVERSLPPSSTGG